MKANATQLGIILLLLAICFAALPTHFGSAGTNTSTEIKPPTYENTNPIIAASVPQSTTNPTYKIVAYYPSWAPYQNFPVRKIAAASVTHINYAFANIQEGKVVMGDPWTDKSNFQQLRTLKQANPKLKTLISVGGWTWSGRFSNVAISKYSRDRFADSAVKFIRDNGFDGVDIDWEYPVTGGLASNKTRPEDKRNFTFLLQAIRNKLDAAQVKDDRTYLLTIAAGAFTGYVNNTEIAKVSSIVNWINLMTYDYHGDWDKKSNHHAPLYADPKDPTSAKSNINHTVTTILKAGAPSKKLVLGIPLYGRSWTNCGSTQQGLYQSCGGGTKGVIAKGIHEYGNLEKQGWINSQGFARYWNAAAKVPWLYKKSTGTFITYEDKESIAHKAGYIKSKGLGGAMLWEISQDYNRTLLNKLIYSLK
ncbi:glycoside hydrolase family 18 protein [Cohnella luojiensis]|uniref:chitinase n=1 Tax=Cohnella luojiensis TaxID=652876 RepID=A0A4Y8LQ85_9BACL|nr:glycoside hydrolase family 18 protein [Cohnella luojiensis]TFE23522.1 glycoside hydrolase family 18 protein [Cohnella luojiensis]